MADCRAHGGATFERHLTHGHIAVKYRLYKDFCVALAANLNSILYIVYGRVSLIDLVLPAKERSYLD